MPRLSPLPLEATPELRPDLDFFLGALGFTPNNVLTMQRKPKLVQELAGLNAAVMDPEGEVDLGFRRLIGRLLLIPHQFRVGEGNPLLPGVQCRQLPLRKRIPLGCGTGKVALGLDRRRRVVCKPVSQYRL